MIWPFNSKFAGNEKVEIFLSVDSGYVNQVLVVSRDSNPEPWVPMLSRENVKLGRICTRVAQRAQLSRGLRF